ncbi:MAG: glycosyltransferase family 4 protein [Planctomycetota bacterium]
MQPTMEDPTPPPPPVLIPLPSGLAISGILLFTQRLASVLAEHDGRVAVLLQRPEPGTRELAVDFGPRVEIIDLRSVAGPAEPGYDPWQTVRACRDAVTTMAQAEPVALLLGQHESVFAAGAALAQTLPELVRPVGIAHSDHAYDLTLLGRYEPMLHGFIAVSEHLKRRLKQTLPQHRADDIAQIAYGVPIPDRIADRQPLSGRPLRILYNGRFEHRQKRVLALPMLAGELSRRGIEHEMTLVGDGPARDELERACSTIPSVTVRPAAEPKDVAKLLDAHDAAVLPSRYEGLSVAMLEALAHGCIPVCAPSESGTAEAITPGITGEIARVAPDQDERAAAMALADAIDALRRRDLIEMARRCRREAEARFSLQAHTRAWCEALTRISGQPPRPWPIDRACALAGDAAAEQQFPRARLAALLEGFAGQPIAVHGSGRFAQRMADLLCEATIAAVADDDRQRHGARFFGCTITGPEAVGKVGVRDVIILSAMHESDIWARRSVYESQGITVHRLHAADEPALPSPA